MALAGSISHVVTFNWAYSNHVSCANSGLTHAAALWQPGEEKLRFVSVICRADYNGVKRARLTHAAHCSRSAVLTRFSHERSSESFTGPMVQNPAKVFLTSPVRVRGRFDHFWKSFNPRYICMDYWSRWTDVLEILSRCLGQMSREASTWRINNLDLIIDQMIFTPSPGAGSKMISLFMTVTWLAALDRIFIFPLPVGLLLRCA